MDNKAIGFNMKEFRIALLEEVVSIGTFSYRILSLHMALQLGRV